MGPPLLEREWHLDALGRWARESRAEGRLVLVGGEAGVGKSSLVRAFAATCGRGMRRLWGACEPLSTPRPLAPLLDIAAAEPALATLLDTAAEPLVLFHALHRSLQSRRDTLLVLEDVHWADDATFDLLGFLGRRIADVPALVIVTHRDDELPAGHPLRLRLGELATLPAIRRLQVTPLSRAAVERLAAGSDVDVDQLWSSTAGNPFFVSEVLAARGTTDVPSSAADAVLARAARLPRLARDVLDVVAVLDTEAGATALEDIVGAAAEGVDQCVGGGLLVPAPGGVSFRHELARMAVYAALPPGRRTRLHRAALHALEAFGAEPALLAHHAELAGDRMRTRCWAERAAEDAARTGAHRQAAAHYARVLRALPAIARRERAALLLRCSCACASSDRIGDATAEAEEALRLWRAEGDTLREADTLSRLALLAWTSDRIGAAVDLGRAAADLLVRLPPSVERARALAIVARLLANHYAHPEATSWARRAVAMAEELGEHRIATHAAVDLGMVLANQGSPSGRGLVEQAVIRARALGADDEAAYGMFALARLASAASDHDGLQATAAAARGFCIERGIAIWGDYVQMIEAQDLLHRGEWARADTLAGELWARTTQTSPASRVAVVCTTLGLLRVRRGEPDPDTLLEVAAGRLTDAPVTNPVLELASARAEAAWYGGRLSTVGAEVRKLWDVARWREGWWVDELRWWLTVADGPAATAREWRAAAQRWAERGHPYHRALALSASAEEAALREALSIAHDLGYRFGRDGLIDRLATEILRMRAPEA